jgi:soluble lytic murein transglycosylase-like protein
VIRRSLFLVASLVAAPALADTSTWTPITAVSSQPLGDADRLTYARAFAAIHAKDWTAATAALDAMPSGALTNVARAELYLAKDAPAVDGQALLALATAAPDLPEAPALARLAATRGAVEVPALPVPHSLVRVIGPSKRAQARPTRGDAIATQLASQVAPLIKANDGYAAEYMIEAVADRLAPEALTELRARTAWAYFLAGNDADTQRVATLARSGTGDWAVQASWIAGLAAWRAGDYVIAADAFDAVAGRSNDSETIAAGFFWAARSNNAAGRIDRAPAQLRGAARLSETFYGMLASASIGLVPTPAITAAPTPIDRPNLRAAAALAEIGEAGLADQMLRQQAKIGPANEHGALIALAGTLGLPATQLWLASNIPAGVAPSLLARYPMPAWRPSGGWRVDRALLFAHALQESQFRTDAVSRAGARGLMQLMPGTVQLVARHKGEAPGSVDDPSVSFEYGQSYLEELADHPGTEGLLPKVIAAYNAGPNNVAAWNARMPGADPLLFIESIPFVETRNYVAIILRNYWMYQQETGAEPVSLVELAQGQWPRFPGAALRTAARSAGGGILSVNR